MRIASYGNEVGAFTLTVAVPTPPPNDAFADGQVISLPDEVTGSNVDATIQAGEPDPVEEDGSRSSVWYRFTALADGLVRFGTCGSEISAILSVYTGSTVTSLTAAADNPSPCDNGRRVAIAVMAGTTYHVRIASYAGEVGTFTLSVGVPSPPANDAFANAVTVGMPQRIEGTNVDATVQAGEPVPDGYDTSGQSVWYRLTMSAAQAVRIDTCESDFDTVLAVYTGDSLGTLSLVGVNDDYCDVGSVVDFLSTAGTTYYISVRGYDGAEGNFALLAGSPPPPPPPPPPVTCPTSQSPAGAVAYRGTHQAGGTVCLTVLGNFSGVASFQMTNVPGDICTFGFAIDRFATPVTIQNRAFSTAKDAITGTFPGDRTAQGTFQLSRTDDELEEVCTAPVLSWTAATSATPPWAIRRRAASPTARHDRPAAAPERLDPAAPAASEPDRRARAVSEGGLQGTRDDRRRGRQAQVRADEPAGRRRADTHDEDPARVARQDPPGAAAHAPGHQAARDGRRPRHGRQRHTKKRTLTLRR